MLYILRECKEISIHDVLYNLHNYVSIQVSICTYISNNIIVVIKPVGVVSSLNDNLDVVPEERIGH